MSADEEMKLTPPPLSTLGVSLEKLTKEQLEALEQMRIEFRDVDYPERGRTNVMFALDDYTFVKFLRARQFNVSKASKILHDHVEFRKRYVPSEVSDATPGVVREMEIMGKSKQGHPVMVYRTRTYDPSRYTNETFLLSRINEWERARKIMAVDGWRVDRFILFCDMAGYKVTKHSSPHALIMVKNMVDIVQSLYRDTVEMCILLNAPAVFQGLYNIVKRWLKPETVRRTVFINDLKQLHEYLTPDNIFDDL